jgi:hypothetical protein
MEDNIVKIDIAGDLEDETPKKEIPMLLEKENYEGIVEENKRSVEKQIKRKIKEDYNLQEIMKELKELKEAIQSKEVYNIMTKKDQKVDNEGYIDLTPLANRNPIPLGTSNIKFPKYSPVPEGNKEVPKKKFYFNFKLFLKVLGYGLGSIFSLIFFTIIFRYLFGNYFLGGVTSLIINGTVLSILYLLYGRNPAKARLQSRNVTHVSNLEYAEIRTCPICDSKVIKGKVQSDSNGYFQSFKCKSPECEFQKKVQFSTPQVSY